MGSSPRRPALLGATSDAGRVPTDCARRLSYRIRLHRGRKGERRSFAETDYSALLDAAHQQLGGSIVLVWDSLNTHISTAMRALIARRDWLTVYRLPTYAPELMWCSQCGSCPVLVA
jgi:hypothetical protein